MIPKVLLIVLKRTMTAWPSGVSAVCLFIYLSTPSVMRLRVDPPAQFFDSRPEWSAERQEREEWLAWAYWRRAVGYVQWRYEFGERLPVEPPLEFRIEEKDLPSSSFASAAAASRPRYWRRFRQVWNQPEGWERTYQWDTSWVGGTLVWVRGAVGKFFERVFGFLNCEAQKGGVRKTDAAAGRLPRVAFELARGEFRSRMIPAPDALVYCYLNFTYCYIL